jgi:hypothetical protein
MTFDRADVAASLVPLGTMTITMAPPTVIDGGPAGVRIVVEFAAVTIDGPRLKAKTRGHTHGDWMTVGPDGTGSLDARFLVETDDGAVLYVRGLGRNDASGFVDGAVNVFCFFFEAADDRYRWLNRAAVIARGRRQEDGAMLFSLSMVS